MKEIIKKLIPSFLINWYHFILPMIGALLYGFPSKKMILIGVTGTNGKSTVVNLTTRILEEAGFKVASLSSIKFKIGNQEWPNTLKMTMPGRLKLQRFLRQALNSGCQYVVIEATSEGIKQHRHRFIDFDVAVLTNLTLEHIEAHGSFEKYREAKGKLFQGLVNRKKNKKISIVNLDDENAGYFLQFPADEKYGYGVSLKSKTENLKFIKATDIKLSAKGIDFTVENISFNMKLLGSFNVYNALAAICVGLSQGVNLKTSKKALERVEGIPGRMEEVISKPFEVFVDYAFTPNALEKVYQTLKPKDSRMICVLGACGGGRDKWKRPVLGGLAGRYCDEVIVTNEDPYNENPMEIINQVAKGAEEKAKKILDRRAAIREALKIAQPGDAVVITGKGCESWICVAGDKKIPWDDRAVVKEEFGKLNL